jgi:hypothetical protein
MSEEGSFWIRIAEKFFGLILIIIGALFVYFTATSATVLGVFTGIFIFLSIVFLAAGVFLLVASAPE